MSEAWTPGPWRLHANWNDTICAGPVGDSHITIARTCEGKSVANAHLIAAAPDLYEALARLVTDYGDVPDDNADADGQAVMDDARAALRKARGEP